MAPDDPALGLRRSTTVVREYDPRWADEFRHEELLLRRTLGDLASGIEHIGSTAVQGLAAKPVLDIAVALADPSTFAELRRRLETCGYDYRGDLGSEGVTSSRRDRSRAARTISICTRWGPPSGEATSRSATRCGRIT